VPNASNEELEGITLSVYLYVVKQGKPVGPREAMKGTSLSSPSVAYRHLEKLENLGLLQKTKYGEYVAKGKASVKGHVWVGRRIIPKMLVYAIVFMGILIFEFTVLALHYAVENYEFKVFFMLLTLITGLAMAVFMYEWLLQRRRAKHRIQTEQTQQST
jgi:uncharacterized membrane protein